MSANGSRLGTRFWTFQHSTHFNTHIVVHSKVWRYSDVPKSFFLQNPDPWAWIVYPPPDVLMKGVAQWIFLLVCSWLGYMIIPNHVSVIVHVCKEGDTWAPCFGHFSIPPHFNTHAGPFRC